MDLSNFTPAYLLALTVIALADFIMLLRARMVKPLKFPDKLKPNNDFTILVPIFGSIKYLKNLEYLKHYSKHVVLCTTTKETDHFYEELSKVAKQHKFRIYKSPVVSASKHRTSPWRLFKSTLVSNKDYVEDEARDEIIRDSFEVVKTKYTIFMDADTITKEELSLLTAQMEHTGFDLSSVRVLVANTDTLISKLQKIEYELAMDSRKIYAWLTSGAAMIAKTEPLKNIMHNHSLFFSGGDIEVGKLGRALKYKVGHIPFEFYTTVPATFWGWVKQRMAWFGGGFRHVIINMHENNWRHPFYFFYTTILVYLLAPLRWYELVKFPFVIIIVIALYWLLLIIFHFRKFSPYLLLFPFYAFIQVMILVPLGVFKYLHMVIRSANPGIIMIRIKEHRGSQVVWLSQIPLKIAFSFTVIGMVAYVTMIRINWTESSLNINTQDLIIADNNNDGQVAGEVTSKPDPTPVVDNKPTVAPVKAKGKYSVKAQKGDSLTHMARIAIRKYEKENELKLDKAQKLFIETNLVAKVNRGVVLEGKDYTFAQEDISLLVEESTRLTTYQKTVWSQYRVDFSSVDVRLDEVTSV